MKRRFLFYFFDSSDKSDIDALREFKAQIKKFIYKREWFTIAFVDLMNPNKFYSCRCASINISYRGVWIKVATATTTMVTLTTK